MSVSYRPRYLSSYPPNSRHSTSSRSSVRTASLDRISTSSSSSYYPPSYIKPPFSSCYSYSNYSKPCKFSEPESKINYSGFTSDLCAYNTRKLSDRTYSRNYTSEKSKDYGLKTDYGSAYDAILSSREGLCRETRPRLRSSLSSSSDFSEVNKYSSKYDHNRRERSCSITRKSIGSSQHLSNFDSSLRTKLDDCNIRDNTHGYSDRNGNKLKLEDCKLNYNRNKSVEKALSSSEEDVKSSSSCSSSSPKYSLEHHTSARKSSGSDEGHSFMQGKSLKSSLYNSYNVNGSGGRVGLRNIGNTCFMNSVLQCLSNTKPLLEYIISDSYRTDINVSNSPMKGELMKAFATLIRDLWNSNNEGQSVTTSSFKSQVQRFAPRFMGYNQQDAQEFLRYLLEGLHEDVNRIKAKPRAITTDIDDSLSDNQKGIESWKRYLRYDDSKIVDIFVGQLKSTLCCTHCGHCSVTFDPFWDLSLPIPSKSSQVRLQQCFDLFTKEEVLDGDEKPTCSKCNTRRKCTKNLTIHKFPRVLVIHLKRFSPTERYRGKLSCYIEFGLSDVNLSSYSSSKASKCAYNLYGVANHSGTTYSGHYTAYCKNPYSGKWNEFNDTRVIKISDSSVVTNEAYVLFYELSGSSSPNC